MAYMTRVIVCPGTSVADGEFDMCRRIVNTRIFITLLLLAIAATPAFAQLSGWQTKLDPVLQQRASLLTGQSRVIVRAGSSGALSSVTSLIGFLGGSLGRSLPVVTGVV